MNPFVNRMFMFLLLFDGFGAAVALLCGYSKRTRVTVTVGYGVIVLLLGAVVLGGGPLFYVALGSIASAGVTLLLLFAPIARPLLLARLAAGVALTGQLSIVFVLKLFWRLVWD